MCLKINKKNRPADLMANKWPTFPATPEDSDQENFRFGCTRDDDSLGGNYRRRQDSDLSGNEDERDLDNDNGSVEINVASEFQGDTDHDSNFMRTTNAFRNVKGG